jgi:PKD repeat protein
LLTHTYAAGGTYDVKLVLIDTNYCNEPDSVIKNHTDLTNVKAQFTTPAFGCVPYTRSLPILHWRKQFTWDFGDGTSSTQTDPTHLYSSTGSYQGAFDSNGYQYL